MTGLLAFTLCLTVSACGNKTESKQPSTADVVKAVSEQVALKNPESMMVLEEHVVSNFYNLDESKLEEKTCLVDSSRYTAQEVSVFKVKDAADVQMVLDAIDERIEDQKIAYENYVPEEMVKLGSPAIYENGRYVILVVADDTSKVQDVFNAQF